MRQLNCTRRIRVVRPIRPLSWDLAIRRVDVALVERGEVPHLLTLRVLLGWMVDLFLHIPVVACISVLLRAIVVHWVLHLRDVVLAGVRLLGIRIVARQRICELAGRVRPDMRPPVPAGGIVVLRGGIVGMWTVGASRGYRGRRRWRRVAPILRGLLLTREAFRRVRLHMMCVPVRREMRCRRDMMQLMLLVHPWWRRRTPVATDVEAIEHLQEVTRGGAAQQEPRQKRPNQRLSRNFARRDRKPKKETKALHEQDAWCGGTLLGGHAKHI